MIMTERERDRETDCRKGERDMPSLIPIGKLNLLVLVQILISTLGIIYRYF